MKKDYKNELKAACDQLLKHDYKIELYNESEKDVVLNFFHLSDVYNALIFCDIGGAPSINYQYSTPTKYATAQALKAARAISQLLKAGKNNDVEKILNFFKECCAQVYAGKYSIDRDIKFCNL